MKPTSESEGILKAMIAEKVNADHIDLKVCLEVFRTFMDVKFDCADDAVLWQTGTWDFTGEKLFSCELVQQFTHNEYNEDDECDEYDHMEQLRMTIYYLPCEELDALNDVSWTYDFDNDVDKFFEALEKRQSLLIPFEKFEPVKMEIELGEI